MSVSTKVVDIDFNGVKTPVKVHSLTNGKFETSVTEYGATIISLIVPTKLGADITADVVLGFDDVQDYLTDKNPCFGAVPGRYANRIAKGKFSLNGQEYSLETNNGPNHLHGGSNGFHKQIWKTSFAGLNEKGQPSVCFTYYSADGEAGFPGDLDISVSYSLVCEEKKNSLKIEYKGKTNTELETLCNVTNHSYFNLSGFHNEADVLNHKLLINADEYVEVDDTLIPTGILKAVKDVPVMSFVESKKIGTDITNIPGAGHGGGYDHSYNLRSGCDVAATAFCVSTGIRMNVFTDQPGIQLYTQNFCNDALKTKKTQQQSGIMSYGRHAGFALETQHHPDSINQSTFPSVVLKPGETYTSFTTFEFQVEN